MQPELLIGIDNHIAFVTLNRPAALNALSYGMVLELTARLKEWEMDDGVCAVLVRGAGERAFCAGGDVRFIYESFKAGSPEHLNFFIEEYQLDHLIFRYPKPYIALMDGIVMGGGMGIAQGALFRVVTGRTRLAMPETAIGLFPDVGASYFLSRLDGAMGAYLGITGKELRPPDILGVGLGDIYLDAQGVSRLFDALPRLEWSGDPAQDLEQCLKSLSGEDLAEPALAPLADVINDCFGEPTLRDILAALEDESRPQFIEWAQQTLKDLGRRSPTMMSVTLRQLQRAKKMSLADCFRMELDMVHECFRHGDFVEGIRALIIDKDGTPKWTPQNIAEVTDEIVNRFFASPWPRDKHPLAALR